MSLEMRLPDSSLDLVDAIAYEFFMDNLQNILGDSLTTPGITDERVLEVVESIALLAEMSYGIAGKFESVRTEFKAQQDDRIQSD